MINGNHEIGISLYLCMENFSTVSTKCTIPKSVQDMIREEVLPSFNELRGYTKDNLLLCPKKSIAFTKNDTEKYLQDCKKLEKELEKARNVCNHRHVRNNLLILKGIVSRIIVFLESLKVQLKNRK